MRILYCNKYNFGFSGTETYLFEVIDLMRSRGHETALFSMADPRGEETPYDRHFVPLVNFKNENDSLIERARLTAHAIYSREARRRLRGMIADFQPDVAHVRNIYHHLSPSILWELKAQGVPVLYHLNDFKLICPSYNMVSHGHACERCKGGAFWHVVSEGCYPRPEGAAWALGAEAYIQKWLRTYERCVDCFLAPSQFVKDKLVENGWDAKKIEVLPHFQQFPAQPPRAPDCDAPVRYFGRLSPEKGVSDLLRAMLLLPGVRLQIAGDGPQRQELESLAEGLRLKNVEFLGHVQGAELDYLIAAAKFTVLPSRAYETFGKSILESYAWGRPVVASDLGSRRELVQDGRTGLLFPPGDAGQMARAISSLAENPAQAAEMGGAGRKLVQDRYTPASHYVALTRLYDQLRPGSAKAVQQALPIAAAKLRVAFIGGRGVISKYSGIETYYEEAGKHLVDIGHEITVYCRTYFTPPQAAFNGMRLIRLPTIRSKHLETVIHTLLSTSHALFQGYDVVHYHALGPALFSFVPRLFGKKTVVTVQGEDWRRKKWARIASGILRLGERAAVRFPNATMVVSQTLQRQCSAVYAADTVYVPNGTKIRKRRNVSHLIKRGIEPGSYILYLGRFSPEKNCHLLIEAYEKIETPVKLVMAGGSAYSDAYAAEMRSHASDKIHLLNWVSGEELDELLVNAMLFVLPSDLEGLSLALLDAMGAGVCVLASDIPENREVVEGAGFTFNRGSAIDLERMLRFLIADPRARSAAAERAQERVRERYLWPQIAKQIDQTYQSLSRPKTLTKTPPSSSARSILGKQQPIRDNHNNNKDAA
jgi:glycosyltransferase involved in cell wall biosynthesis